MFIIRQEHQEAFRESSRRNFRERTVAEAREVLPEAAELSDHDLNAMTAEGIDRASECGIIYEDDVKLFVGLLIVNGRNFGKDPSSAAGAILRKTDLDGTEKITELMLEHDRLGTNSQ
jgi:hypothetical protein